eukprot:TRINITY_DN627_c0_g1_i2.p2 TRINITY_DN627_c0_g1~~TRINITY_DN627_c0_g1_i2.p2  ORF type:complete len:115 (-),score=30.20 TRINITY_DN627_c0_g1_i2:229-573(-)
MHWHQQQQHHRMQRAVVDDNSKRGTHIDTASSLPHTTTTPTITTPPTPLVPELQEAEEPVISAATPPSPGDSPTPATRQPTHLNLNLHSHLLHHTQTAAQARKSRAEGAVREQW